MSELLSVMLGREAKPMSGKGKALAGYHSHRPNRVSARFLKWKKACASHELEAHLGIQENMRAYLHTPQAMTLMDEIPQPVRSIIEFVQFEGPQFSRRNFTGLVRESCAESKTVEALHATAMALEDQLLATSLLADTPQPNYDVQEALHTLELASKVLENPKGDLRINANRHYTRPMVLPDCFQFHDPCRFGRPQPIPNRELPNGDVEDKKPCLCEQEPTDDPCSCACSDECIVPDDCCATIRPYFGELIVVRDELKCYEPGELSYIENVIKGETLERTHRVSSTLEITDEEETTTVTTDTWDQQVTDEFKLHKEVERVVDASLSADYTNYKTSYGASLSKDGISVTPTLSPRLVIKSSLSLKDTRKLVQDESRKIITKATNEVSKTIRTKRIQTSRLENEITNVHRLTAGADTSRQFTYVNQVKEAQMYSHGGRMMFDLYLPEVSELYKHLLEEEFGLNRPEKPCINIDEISPDDYNYYVQCCGMTDLEPPIASLPETYMTVESKEEKPKGGGNQWSISLPVSIPAGYIGTEIKMTTHKLTNALFTFSPRSATFSLAGRYLVDTTEPGDGNPPDDWGPKTGLNLTGSHTATITVSKLRRYEIAVRIKLTPLPVDNSVWQREVYRRICKKYEEDLAAYEAAFAEFEEKKQAAFRQNPLVLSRIINEQLRQAAISYITCQFFDDNNALHSKTAPCGFPQMNIRETERKGRVVAFFEKALEWHFMQYKLYPYYWGRKCSWADKVGENGLDDLFTEFLQAGFARMVLSVTPGFEALVAYYLSTGQIWGSTGIPPLLGNGSLPLYQEIRESQENYNVDREGTVICDTSLALPANQIVLQNNDDYFLPGTLSFDPLLAAPDLNREIIIGFTVYKIIAIAPGPGSGDITITLDRDFAGDKDRAYPWSTGALYLGTPWEFRVATSLTWLREEKRCLPCYPIGCEEAAVVVP